MRQNQFTQIISALLVIAASHTQLARGTEWSVQLQHGAIEVYSECPIPSRDVFAALDDVRREFSDQLGLSDEAPKIQIVVFRTFDSYRRYLANRIPQATSRRAIFYQNGQLNQIYAVHHKGLLTDLRHEFTHALLHHHLPYVPLWIDEGVAEYFEERSTARHRSSRMASVRWKCRTGRSPRLTSLESIRTAASMTSDDYQNSWAWVYFLLHQSENSRSVFRDYLSAVSAGEAAGQFSTWASKRDPGLLSQFGSYFRRFAFRLGSARP